MSLQDDLRMSQRSLNGVRFCQYGTLAKRSREFQKLGDNRDV